MLKDPDGNFVEIVGPNTKKLSANNNLKIFQSFKISKLAWLLPNYLQESYNYGLEI